VETLVNGADFQISFIPPDYDLDIGIADFEGDAMRRLYESAADRARREQAWSLIQAPSDAEGLGPLIDPAWAIDALEARPEYREGAASR
jgi:hypothetical protein